MRRPKTDCTPVRRGGDGVLEAFTGNAGAGGEWGPVCDDFFDTDDKQAEVICRQMGYLDSRGGQTGDGISCWPRCSVQCNDLTSEYCRAHPAGR